MRFAGTQVNPEDVVVLAGYGPKESDLGEVAGVIDPRDPRSQISGRGVSGISPAAIEAMPAGPEQEAMRRRLQRMQGAVDLPGFLRGA